MGQWCLSYLGLCIPATSPRKWVFVYFVINQARTLLVHRGFLPTSHGNALGSSTLLWGTSAQRVFPEGSSPSFFPFSTPPSPSANNVLLFFHLHSFPWCTSELRVPPCCYGRFWGWQPGGCPIFLPPFGSARGQIQFSFCWLESTQNPGLCGCCVEAGPGCDSHGSADRAGLRPLEPGDPCLAGGLSSVSIINDQG